MAVNDGLGRALVVGLFVVDGLVEREGLWSGGVGGKGGAAGGLGWWGVTMAAWVGVYGSVHFPLKSPRWRHCCLTSWARSRTEGVG